MAQAQVIQQGSPPSPPKKYVTLTEYFEASDQYPAEVVDGEIVRMSPAQRGHSRLIRKLLVSLHIFCSQNDLGEVWSETSFVLDGIKGPDWVSRVRQPDVSFIAKKRVEDHDTAYGIDEGAWWLAPDLAVEIISPSDKYIDVVQKVAEYLQYGVRQVWLVNPPTRTVRIYTSENHDGIELDGTATLTADPVIPGWSMPVKDLFDTAK
jgi:Uma2 family endonuclease